MIECILSYTPYFRLIAYFIIRCHVTSSSIVEFNVPLDTL